MDALKNFKDGQQVDIEINLRGRFASKNGKDYVFNSLQGWKIEAVNKVAKNSKIEPAKGYYEDLNNQSFDDSEQLPF